MMSRYMEKALEGLQGQMEDMLSTVVGFCVKVIVAIVVFYVGIRLIRWLLGLLRQSMEKAGVDTGVIQFTFSISRVAMYAFLIFGIATYFGVMETSVAALLGTSGLTLGLGFQGGLTNLVGGMMILLFKPFVVGDYIILEGSQGIEGTVARIEMFYTTLSTIDNRNIVIPNGTLSNSCVSNLTARDSRKLEIKVQISYESSILTAKEILTRLLREDEAIRSDEPMDVFVDQLADHGVVIGFRAWVSTEEYWRTKWRMNEKIKAAFDAAGVGIPYPQMDVHLSHRDISDAGDTER